MKLRIPGRITGFREENAASERRGFVLVALVGLLGVWAGSVNAADPTITNAEDEIFWDNGGGNGESVTIDGTNFDGDSRIYLSSNNTLDAGKMGTVFSEENGENGDSLFLRIRLDTPMLKMYTCW